MAVLLNIPKLISRGYEFKILTNQSHFFKMLTYKFLKWIFLSSIEVADFLKKEKKKLKQYLNKAQYKIAKEKKKWRICMMIASTMNE